MDYNKLLNFLIQKNKFNLVKPYLDEIKDKKIQKTNETIEYEVIYYLSLSSIKDINELWDQISKKKNISVKIYDLLIDFYLKSGRFEEFKTCFSHMSDNNVTPNRNIHLSILKYQIKCKFL
jgi:pentatricopeptide repeat protein